MTKLLATVAQYDQPPLAVYQSRLGDVECIEIEQQSQIDGLPSCTVRVSLDSLETLIATLERQRIYFRPAAPAVNQRGSAGQLDLQEDAGSLTLDLDDFGEEDDGKD